MLNTILNQQGKVKVMGETIVEMVEKCGEWNSENYDEMSFGEMAQAKEIV